MTRFILLSLVLAGIISCSNEAEVELAVHIPELRCTDGQHLIESYLLELDGIRSVAVNLDQRHLTVRYKNKTISEDVLLSTLLSKGFTVDGLAGDQNARRRLPSCCLEEDL